VEQNLKLSAVAALPLPLLQVIFALVCFAVKSPAAGVEWLSRAVVVYVIVFVAVFVFCTIFDRKNK
jgi:hypothetical protein